MFEKKLQQKNKRWYLRWWAFMLYFFIFIVIIVSMSDTSQTNVTGDITENKKKNIEETKNETDQELIANEPSSIIAEHLGKSLSQAKSKTSIYEAQYGAILPLFETDNNGNVVFECWVGPPEDWSEEEAMEFARNLLPLSLKDKIPDKDGIDGTEHSFIFSDGTTIILHSSYVKDKYMMVEIRTSNYDGPSC
ncbi:hypothetical protein ACFL1Y_01615 [Patescibacteria group bacterium]